MKQLCGCGIEFEFDEPVSMCQSCSELEWARQNPKPESLAKFACGLMLDDEDDQE